MQTCVVRCRSRRVGRAARVDQATVLTLVPIEQSWNLEDAQRALYNGDYEVAEQLT